MSHYAASGVNIPEGNRVVERIQDSVTKTWNKLNYGQVTSKFGDYAGLYQLGETTLATSIDGVGTKTIAAVKTLGLEGYRLMGHDIVNHCVNDILVKGAEPLFFQDYIASSKISADSVATFVQGVSEACSVVGCALIGGETAEMPGVYRDSTLDIVGSIVGRIVNPINGPESVRDGDSILGLRSTGLHTNGWSLARQVLADIPAEYLRPHACYYHDIKKLWQHSLEIHGLCHITGGGFDNAQRVLPEGLTLYLTVPDRPPFREIRLAGAIPVAEMFQVFNMGFGMLIFMNAADAQKALELFPERQAQILGQVVRGTTPKLTLQISE